MSPTNQSPQALAALADEPLLEALQRQTFGFFWEGAHGTSGLARDRCTTQSTQTGDLVATGGSGFGIMAMIVAAERGWAARDAVLERILRMTDLLAHARSYHGALSHFIDGRTGATIPFARKDDGGDLVETSFLMMGLLCARQYFTGSSPGEKRLRDFTAQLWHEVEWNWYTRDGRMALHWHWSPNNGWAIDLPIRGWNECLITYVLAAAAPRYGIDPAIYQQGFAAGRDFINGNSYYDIPLPLGLPYGGPLSFAQYSFLGIDPRGLTDRYADYWVQNLHHARINQAHCRANPLGHRGYSEVCWGLTASDDPAGYAMHSPAQDNGTIAPTAALSSMPYTPSESLAAARHFLTAHGERIWGPFGFTDAFCEDANWFADSYVAIDQAPIIVMIENHRSGLLWRLGMSCPEVRLGLRRLHFSSPQLPTQ